MNAYYELDYSFSFLRTKDDAEIDLIIEKPDDSIVLVEIKSSDKIDERHVRFLQHFQNVFKNAKLICASRVNKPQKINQVLVLPWEEALTEIFLQNRY